MSNSHTITPDDADPAPSDSTSTSTLQEQNAAANAADAVNDLTGNARVPFLTPTDWSRIRTVARDNPLAHPLPFSMGALTFDYPTPTHLVELYGSLYRAVMPQYPNSPKQLLRLMPRDHGKSEAGSVVFPTWLALANPNIRILIMMHKEGKAAGKLQQCTNHIEALAPRCGRTIDRSNTTELQLARTENYDVPTIEAAGFESGLTGGHYDVIIMDDIVRWETQNTTGQREKALSKFENAINLGDEGETTYVVLGTRKHRRDLYSNLLKRPAWHAIVRKAISDFSVVENGEYDLVTNSGTLYPAERYGSLPPGETLVDVVPHRDVSVLWPDRYSLSDLIFEYLSAGGGGASTAAEVDDGDADDISDGMGSGSEWIREKQNSPEALEGNILNTGMLTYHDHFPWETQRNKDDLVNFVGIDVGIEADPQRAVSADADFWALSVVGYDPHTDTAYVQHLTRRRGMTVNEAVNWTQRELRDYDYGTVHVESVQAQDFFRQALADEGVPTTKVNPSRKKEERIISMSSWFENGRCRIIGNQNSAKWQSFEDEWAAFPTGSHDDRLDTLSIALHALGEWRSSPKSQFHFN